MPDTKTATLAEIFDRIADLATAEKGVSRENAQEIVKLANRGRGLVDPEGE